MPASPSVPPLVDTTGQPLCASPPASSHHAADRFSQELANWNPPMMSADRAYLAERDTIVARTRDVARNNGWISGAMQRFTDQAIGASFRLSARPDWRALGITFEQAQDWRKEVEPKFRAWADDLRNYADASEQTNLAGLLGTAFRQRLVDGECLMLAPWIRRGDFPWRTAIQMIDPDRLSNPHDKPDTDKLRGGIELNRFGAAIAYHIRDSHPGDVFFFGRGAYTWKRVPRRLPWGRARVIHFFEREQAGQTRGKSILTPILEATKMESMYARTELQAALVNAIFAAVIKSPFDPEMMESALTTLGDSYQDQRLKFHEQSGISINGMRIPMLFPNEEIEFLKSERPNAAFADFERTVLRYLAAGIGQSYEQLAQDWSSTNYSSARAAMLEAHKFLTARRDSFAQGVGRQIYALWLEESIDNGTVPLPAGAPAFWDNPAAWARCRWIGPGRGWVDPTKEANAAGLRMDHYLSAGEDEAAEQGRDFEEIYEQQAYERKRREELGLPETTTATVRERRLAPGGREPAGEGVDDDPDENDGRESRQQARSFVPASP